jgi:hypothetical protein
MPMRLNIRLKKWRRSKPDPKDGMRPMTLEEHRAYVAPKAIRYHDPNMPQEDEDEASIDPDTGERQFSVFSQATTLAERNLSLDKDHTEMLHSFVDTDFLASKDVAPLFPDADREFIDPEVLAANERRLASLSSELWTEIASFLTPLDAANLALSSKTLFQRLGSEPLTALNLPENKQYKIEFLAAMDKCLPRHLLCFPCATFHLRTRVGQERLKADYVSNPIFNCPNVRHSILPRMRLTHGYVLPYSYIQLLTRAHRHSPVHGIPTTSVSRRWKCKDSDWSHETRVIIHKDTGHVLFRSISKHAAIPDLVPSQERLLLYSRSDYEPYFSVCAHWRDGVLMNICKCALSHVPKPRKRVRDQIREKPQIHFSERHVNPIVRLCNECLYMRRCPQCPTEYLIEVRMVEDRTDKINPFKHAIVVTRWSDLGDGSSPTTSVEWAACNGTAEIDSFQKIGKRAVAGAFESQVSGCPPGQKVLSLNPSNTKKGIDGNNWY